MAQSDVSLSDIGAADTDLDMNEYDISGVDQITIPDNGDSSGKNLLQIGDDVYFTDIDSSNTLGIQGIGENAVGNIKLGSAGPTLSGTSSGNLDLNGNLNVNNQLTVGSTVCNTGQYIDGDGSCTSVTGETSGEYVNEAGDTMTGDLNMQGNSVQNVGILNASTIQIDGNDIGGLFVDESGDSMSGNLNMQNHHIDNLAHLELNSGSGADIRVDGTDAIRMDGNQNVEIPNGVLSVNSDTRLSNMNGYTGSGRDSVLTNTEGSNHPSVPSS